MTAALLNGEFSPKETIPNTPPPQPDTDQDILPQAKEAAKRMSLGQGTRIGLAGVGIVAAAVPVMGAIGQAEQRASVNEELAQQTVNEQIASTEEQNALMTAMDTVNATDVIEPFTLSETSNSIEQNAVDLATKHGITDINLQDIHDSAAILAKEIPQPNDTFVLVSKDIDGDGKKDLYVAPETNVIQNDAPQATVIPTVDTH